jgi:hypothetical protein
VTGPNDGKKTTYYFGRRGGSSSFKVEAMSLAKAVRAFRIGALFPHQYSSAPIGEKVLGERGYEDTVYQSSKPGAHIPVHVSTPSEGWIEVGQIPPEAPVEADFGPALIAAQGHLAHVDPTGTTALAKPSANTGLQAADRHSLEQKQLELQAAMGELERQKRELSIQVSAMREEMKRRMEQIWMIELFLGSKEEVKRLAEGVPAPAEEPITVRQLVLCMDEEIAVYHWMNNPDMIGEFDWKNLEDFDTWLTEDPAHLDSIFPHKKGIVSLKVRRHVKNRDYLNGSIGGILQKISEEQNDNMTYLLVRNGGNLYRLWVDVMLWPRLFPAEADYASMSSGGHFDMERAQKRMKTYMAGLLVIQGLIERSDLFHPLPKAGISVFKPQDQHYFDLIRDGEGYGKLVDGTDKLAHVTWKGYRAWLREQLAAGVRVYWTGKQGYEDNALERRLGYINKSINVWPERGVPYTLEGDGESNWGYPFTFLYLPDDSVYVRSEDWRGEWSRKARTRRVRFGVHRDEMIPLDFLSWRVLEHLIYDRNQRSSYASFFKMAFFYWRMKKKEAEREKPFVDLVLTRADVGLDNEDERARCERLVRWWKLKTKTHRELGTDEAKALRMIEKAFRNGDDHDNDPETLLLKRD